MDVQSFKAASLREALKQVKGAFGKDAVILSTKEIKGHKGEKIVEVNAAAPSQSLVQRAPGAQSAQARSDEMSDLYIGLSHKFQEWQEKALTKNHIQGLETAVFDLKMLLLQNLRSVNPEYEIFEDLPENMIASLSHALHLGLEMRYIQEFVLAFKAKNLAAKKAREPAPDLNFLYQWFMRKTRLSAKWVEPERSQNIHILVGPHGVGKSAMAQKLAAEFFLKQNLSVLLLSYDPHKLAAYEGQKLYAKIIGVHFESLNDLGHLDALLQKYSQSKLVILDVGGVGPKQADLIDKIRHFREQSLNAKAHLCLSLTEKSEHLDRNLRAYSAIGINSLIFNKIDEVWSYGDIFNLSQRWSVPLSYFGTGPKVPDDFERASRERVVERLFSLNHEGS